MCESVKGKNWYQNRSEISDGWDWHALHSLGRFWHMQISPIILHGKLPIHTVSCKDNDPKREFLAQSLLLYFRSLVP